MKAFMNGIVAIVLLLMACLSGYAAYAMAMVRAESDGPLGFGFLAVVLVGVAWAVISSNDAKR